MNLPAHLLDHLAATTGVDHRVVSRKARRNKCPRCGAWTIRGLDDDTCATDARIDPIPLTPLGEEVATRAGIGTWTLTISARGIQIDGDRYRGTPLTIRRPAGQLARADVVPGHACGRRWLPPCIAPTRIPGPSPPAAARDQPPY